MGSRHMAPDNRKTISLFKGPKGWGISKIAPDSCLPGAWVKPLDIAVLSLTEFFDAFFLQKSRVAPILARLCTWFRFRPGALAK